MSTHTTNLNLVKPGATDPVNVSDINGNMDIIDGAVQGLRESVTQIATNLGRDTAGAALDFKYRVIDTSSVQAIAETILNSIARTDNKTAVQIGVVAGRGIRAYVAYRYPYSAGNYGVCVLLSAVDYTLVVVKNYNGTYTTFNVAG